MKREPPGKESFQKRSFVKQSAQNPSLRSFERFMIALE